MSTRCIACNTKLHGNQVGYVREIELEDETVITVTEDLCTTCRNASTLDINILEKEYQLDNLTDGIATPSAGFSDDY